jgi:rod shape determining protein RodA
MFTRFNPKRYNFPLLITVIIAIGIGCVMVNSADSSYTQRQLIGAVVGIVLMIFVSFIDYGFICRFYVPLYIINLVLLALVLFMGVNVNNATRWLVIGGDNGVQFQPSELSKLIVIICAATFLDKYKKRNKINSFKCLALFALLTALTLFLISQEPDLSTTLCHMFILVTILYVSGLSYKLIIIALLILVPLSGSFLWYIQQPGDKILIKQYQINRILPFIYPSKYGDESSQQNNSIMAIGSGQLTGKGLNTSTIATVKDANFISEQQTDFIFSVIGEELGFIGSVIIIAILLLIVLQCIRVAKRAKDTKGMLIATGLGVQIGFQSFINIGVASGVLPNTGIPLPFISYGLSSLFSVAIGMGMVLNISQQEYRLMD